MGQRKCVRLAYCNIIMHRQQKKKRRENKRGRSADLLYVMSWVVEVGEQRHHRCNDFYRVFITIDLFAQLTYGIYLNLVINIQYLRIYIFCKLSGILLTSDFVIFNIYI